MNTKLLQSRDLHFVFKRIQYIKLFILMIQRGICFLIERCVVRSYTNTSIRFGLNAQLSKHFRTSNGVKQGAIYIYIAFDANDLSIVLQRQLNEPPLKIYPYIAIIMYIHVVPYIYIYKYCIYDLYIIIYILYIWPYRTVYV